MNQVHHRFEAMSVNCEVVFDDDGSATDVLHAAAHAAQRRVEQLAAVCTRFDVGSELMRLNQSRSAIVSAELLELLQAAVSARDVTSGDFDPTLGASIAALGYDRTFAELGDGTPPATTASRAGELAPISERGIEIDPTTQRVTLRAGTQLDVGGIAKGWIADRIRAEFEQLAPVLVTLGGDIACSPRVDDAPWVLDVEHVSRGGPAMHTVTLQHGGVATSGTAQRRWVDPATGALVHQVLDPRTGRNPGIDIAVVTAVAASCTRAEAAATALLLTPARELLTRADMLDVSAVATLRDGWVLSTRS